MRMMDEPVNDRYGHVVIDKEFVSVGKFLIQNPNRKVNNLYNNIIYLQIVTLYLIAVYIKNWNY
ncbi:hypothetical protein SAMN05421863_10588 [Nitrosomonas communis]|uniref:Uncharacterized protein n=1 Tax=Nitrosomonas communis TaxID=44574 RepID=A0A1I4U1S7_9PROT|nr:hypothetical protein SAMN05421863_10588 [Nitrosomonas communis]